MKTEVYGRKQCLADVSHRPSMVKLHVYSTFLPLDIFDVRV